MGVIGQQGDSRAATPEELQQYQAVSERLSQVDPHSVFDANDPHQRLMVIAFDGTSSDREKSNATHTNPDILEQLVATSETVSSMYVHGVGTRSHTPIHSMVEMATGTGSKSRAEQAYREFVSEVRQWHQQDPLSEPHLVTLGYSRGVGSQRHFANLVEDLGVPNQACTGYLIEPGAVQQGLMLMYDGVVTGQERQLDLPIPSDLGIAIHLFAQEEDRMAFDLVSAIDPLRPEHPGRFEEPLLGFHSDVGGGDQYGGLSAHALQLGIQALERHGVPLESLPALYDINEQRFDINEPNRLSPVNWALGPRDTDQFSDAAPGPRGDRDDSLNEGCSLSQ